MALNLEPSCGRMQNEKEADVARKSIFQFVNSVKANKSNVVEKWREEKSVVRSMGE